MLKKTNGLNAETLRPFDGWLSNYSLCRYFDRLQRLLSRVFRDSTRNVPLILADVYIRKRRQPSIKDMSHGSESRSCDFLPPVSARQMGASMCPLP
jgi:hypothetical protein